MDLLAIASRISADPEEDGQEVDTSVVKKTPGKGYCVKSEKNPDWNGGCFPSKGEAKKRLNQVEYFKHKGSLDPAQVEFVRSYCAMLLASDRPSEFQLEILRDVLSSYNGE